jgi:hypothetical protein
VIFPFRPTHLIFLEQSWIPQRNSHFQRRLSPASQPLLCVCECVPSRNTIIIPATSDKSFCLPTTRRSIFRRLCVTKRAVAARAKSALRANARLQMRPARCCKIKRPLLLHFCKQHSTHTMVVDVNYLDWAGSTWPCSAQQFFALLFSLHGRTQWLAVCAAK